MSKSSTGYKGSVVQIKHCLNFISLKHILILLIINCTLLKVYVSRVTLLFGLYTIVWGFLVSLPFVFSLNRHDHIWK